MTEEKLPLFVGVETIKSDLGVSRAKAYEVIKELNAEMKAQNPRAIVVNGTGIWSIWCDYRCNRRQCLFWARSIYDSLRLSRQMKYQCLSD
ncbi:hypothetical protein [Lacrimispora defluvii]|uniref:Uncharacterized protein n=1 Tax=Lacrimispora defluvii TaxID=2719233 RepID=A0ABX1VXW0_9FIRM|nr:hypothetical protein [Lacrimispora defluvii]NNJ33284.1 hypothetical protein [Lacrimispora defluvii]